MTGVPTTLRSGGAGERTAFAEVAIAELVNPRVAGPNRDERPRHGRLEAAPGDGRFVSGTGGIRFGRKGGRSGRRWGAQPGGRPSRGKRAGLCGTGPGRGGGGGERAASEFSRPPQPRPPQPRSRRRRSMAGEPGWPWTRRAVDREVPQPQPLTLLEASAAARGCPLHHRDGRGRDDFSDCKKWVNCSGWEIVWEPGCKVGADTAGSVDTTGGSCAGTWQPGSGRDAIGGSLAVVSCVESARSTRDLLRPRLPDPGV